jgi:hypothetical protein
MRNSFIDAEIVSEDTLDFHYRAMKLFQDLTRLHLNDPNHDVLIDLEMKRLRFLYRNATVDMQDTLYIASLRNLASKENNWPECTQAYYEIATVYEKYGRQYAMGEKPGYKPYLLMAEEACNQGIAAFPYSQGGLQCKALKAQINQKSLSVNAGIAYARNENLKFRLEYGNISKVFVRLVRNDAADLSENDRADEEKRLKRYLKMPQVKGWELALPVDNDKQVHATEFRADSLKPGSYVVLVASDASFKRDKNCVAVTEFFVSDIAYLTRNSLDGFLEVQVMHRSSGLPLAGVTVNTWLSGYDYTARKYLATKEGTYQTDEDGRVRIPASNNYRNVRLELITRQ